LSIKQDYANSGIGVVDYIFPKETLLHRSALNDYLFFYTDILFQGAFIGVLFSSVSVVVSYFTETGLNDWLPVFKGRLQGVYGIGMLSTLFLAVTADFALFFSHFLQHRVPMVMGVS
jgi:sterol desaturase/sphingolipid hydroxylase (fatty acid hydroxylase superfamily)